MLDLRQLRSHTDDVKAALARRLDPSILETLDCVLHLDERRRTLQGEVDAVRAERNRQAEEIGRRKKAGEDASEAMAAAQAGRERLAEVEEDLRAVSAELNDRLLTLPNPPDASVPEGATEDDGVIVRTVGEQPDFGFEPKDHVALGGWMIDLERGARTSGSRFGYLLGDLVLLHMATVRFAVDALVGRGFIPVLPPVLVRASALEGTGYFPGERDQIYALERDDLFLVGTSEVPLAALHQDEILPAEDLPRRYCAVSSCFRREAGAAGKDTRGIFRTHQFEKVEMFSFCHPDRSWEEHELLLSIEEELAQALGFHYQVKNIASGDLGASAAKKYDLEVWLPGQGRYRELTSCSNTTDYQARRLQARFRPEGGKGSPQVLHTLNGTAVTSSRTLIALMETHQQADGSMQVPEVLRRLGAPHVIGPVSS
jgi:seryl-tRNA synthetase